MKYHVQVSPRAEADIERNAIWWADNHSAEQAARWFYGVHDQLQSLKTFPSSRESPTVWQHYSGLQSIIPDLALTQQLLSSTQRADF